ncbi:hypothetical protein [Nocardia sp. CNY236]|uniref:hypothetical protein n=1 Tax=Nocardia sp. CNY236 TaxID=1169152 RepID=UPI00048AE354|nr:hypothetical protein [Nocardia sp. CNY236]
MDTRQDIQEQIDMIQTNKESIDQLPDKVQSGFEDLVLVVRIMGHTATGFNPLGHFAVEKIVEHLCENRDEIISAVEDVKTKLSEFLKGALVPITFIYYADRWRSIEGTFMQARTAWGATDLKSDWQGIAADRYRDMRDLQGRAFHAMRQLSGAVAPDLEAVALEALEFYKDLAEHSTKFAENVAESVTVLATKGPFAALEAKEIMEMAMGLAKFITDTLGDLAEMAHNLIIYGNRIARQTAVQDGIPDNKWPSAVTGRVEENGTVVLPGEEYSDGSVLDDNNKWSVKSDRIIQ